MPYRPDRLKHIAGIGVDQMGSIADASGADFLRLENLDVDIPPDEDAVLRTQRAASIDADNSYLPFVGSAGFGTSRPIMFAGIRRCLFRRAQLRHLGGRPVGHSQRTARDDRGRRRSDRHRSNLRRPHQQNTADGRHTEVRFISVHRRRQVDA